MATKAMSENSKKVLAFLKDNGVGTEFTYNQVKDALGFAKVASVVGTITSFGKKGIVEKSAKTVEVTDENGNVKTKEIKTFALTQAGMDFDPDATAAE